MAAFKLVEAVAKQSYLVLPGLLLVYLVAKSMYKLIWHPYAPYPGPFWAKLTSFYALYHAYKGDVHLDILRCHEKYGTHIRYAPDRLVINTNQAIKDIYGQGKNLQKSRAYAPHPYYPTLFNTHNCIDKAMHARKRRIVTQGFSERAVGSSENFILTHVRNLCKALSSSDECQAPFPNEDGWTAPKNMASWSNFLTLDVISDLTFGRAFDLITKPDLRWVVDAIVRGNQHIYMRFQYPAAFSRGPNSWLSIEKWLFPTLQDERARFVEVATEASQTRMKSMDEMQNRKDIMSHLLVAKDPKTGDKLTDAEVWGEAHLMIAAGGDTTSTAISAALFYLSRTPSAYDKLAAEIRGAFPTFESIRSGAVLTSCAYLLACIEESLRLAPPAPGALWREVSPGGATVTGQRIPAGYDVAVCLYAIGHNDTYFPDSYAYKPERFLAGSEFSEAQVALAKSAFAPFSIGPRSCVAKPLAYLEMSLALAGIIWLMEFRAVDTTGEGRPGLGRGRERKEEFQIIDMFSSSKDGPVLKFKVREGAKVDW